jgi:catechol 2,3-dioxygenase-like lactoylglutathione lyase family enzyme
MFQFERPSPGCTARRPGCDLGYTRVGFWVAASTQLSPASRVGSQPLSDPIGEPGCRRACVRSPDRVFVEIMEDDPLISRGGQAPASADCPVAVRSVTLSVADLDQSAAFLSDGLGMLASGAALRRPEHEALWSLPGAATRSQVFDAGDVLVEVVQYLDPVGRPNRTTCISDRHTQHGPPELAAEPIRQLYRACASGAAQQQTRPFPGPRSCAISDPQQFSVEIIRLAQPSDKHWGFTPS